MEQEILIDIPDPKTLRELFGEHDRNLKTLENITSVKIIPRDNKLKVIGKRVDLESAEITIKNLISCIRRGFIISDSDIERAYNIIKSDPSMPLENIFCETILHSAKKRSIFPKSRNQKRYVDIIREFDIVFSIGPAGTGKTYLAMAMAVNYLNSKLVDRIILTRPAVEAGERLGFLPGNISDKVHPYLRPLYDALHDMMDIEKAQNLIEKGIIEVAPLAYMRGRTLNDSFVILDEAQNTTHEQMKMFLTRLGFNSKCVVTGDITQIDLPHSEPSGLLEVIRILKRIDRIAFHYFTEVDVVRHKLVKAIIKAYEKDQSKK